jgi:prolipoprotein diacylglyceryltransferase
MFLAFEPYGLCIAIGVLFALTIANFFSEKKNIGGDLNFIFFLTYIAAFLCGKFFFVFESWLLYDTTFCLYSFDAWWYLLKSGFCILGASFGGILGLYYAVTLSTKNKDNYALFPILIFLIHMFGRLGCLYAGCCNGSCLGISLYPIVIIFYLLLFVVGVIFYRRGNIATLRSALLFYAFGVFLERLLFDIFREDAYFLFFPVTYYHIIALVYFFFVILVLKLFFKRHIEDKK